MINLFVIAILALIGLSLVIFYIKALMHQPIGIVLMIPALIIFLGVKLNLVINTWVGIIVIVAVCLLILWTIEKVPTLELKKNKEKEK